VERRGQFPQCIFVSLLISKRALCSQEKPIPHAKMHASDMEHQAEFENSASSKEGVAEIEDSNRLDRFHTIEIDNYHGITATTILVYAVRGPVQDDS
jgi:hypothetical protein